MESPKRPSKLIFMDLNFVAATSLSNRVVSGAVRGYVQDDHYLTYAFKF